MSEADTLTEPQTHCVASPDPAPDSPLTTVNLDGFAALATLPEMASLVGLMQELQQHNLFLLDRVNQLETALHTCHTQLQNPPETLTTGHTEVEQHLASLLTELENSQEIARRQQDLIEATTTQLQSTQERVAQLERECAFSQQRYNEQTYALIQCEYVCADLRSRLRWQERYTSQLKSALERALERAQVDSEVTTIAQTVPPWSVHATDSTLTEVEVPSAPDTLETASELQTEISAPVAEFSAPTAPTEPEANEDDFWHELAQLIDPAEEPSQQETPVAASGKTLEWPAEAAIVTTLEAITAATTVNLVPDTITVQQWQPTDSASKPYRDSHKSPKPMLSFELCPNGPTTLPQASQPQNRVKSRAAIDLPQFPRLASPS